MSSIVLSGAREAFALLTTSTAGLIKVHPPQPLGASSDCADSPAEPTSRHRGGPLRNRPGQRAGRALWPRTGERRPRPGPSSDVPDRNPRPHELQVVMPVGKCFSTSDIIAS